VSSEADFGQQLRESSQRLNATIAFDAIAGAQTGELLNAMPRGAHVLVYGALSLALCRSMWGRYCFASAAWKGFGCLNGLPNTACAGSSQP
jgi:NADPH:quinone reductase-like Zn-dependent oxidoreductase